jgi:hypothetical protein
MGINTTKNSSGRPISLLTVFVWRVIVLSMKGPLSWKIYAISNAQSLVCVNIGAVSQDILYGKIGLSCGSVAKSSVWFLAEFGAVTPLIVTSFGPIGPI